MSKSQGVPKKWTPTYLESLKPRSSTYSDPAQQGLLLLVRPQSRSWVLRYQIRKVEKRIVLGHFPETKLHVARAEASRLLALLREQGIDPEAARPSRRAPSPAPAGTADTKHSVDFLVAEFIERKLRKERKRPEWAERILQRDVLSQWSGRDARTITAREVVELLDRVVDRGSKVMANRVTAIIGQMFVFGITRAIVTATPVPPRTRPGGKEKARERALSDAELRAYLKDPTACTRYDRLSRVITLLLLTGQRRGELAAAAWSDVDLKARTWTIPDANAKAGRGHVVPLSAWAVEEFKALKAEAEGSAWVLSAADAKHPVDAKLLTRGVAKCLKRFKTAGIAAFTLHDLRRTCRTGLSALKVEPHIAERVLNHAQPGVEGVYDRHAYLDEKREALDKWAAHLKELTART
jgi:integrase